VRAIKGQPIAIVFALSAIVFALCSSAKAQQPGKVFHIGYLDQSTAAGRSRLLDEFRQEMRKLGWIEGNNITIEYRFAEGKSDRLPELAAELVRLKVDLIAVSATPAALAAKSVTNIIPIVMTNAGDPVAAGLVESLARPGGNVTGFAGLSPELSSKRLEILSDAIPKLVKVGLLRPAGRSLGMEFQLKEIRSAAAALKLKLEEIETQFDLKSLERTFQTTKQKQVGAIMTASNPSFFAARKPIIELARRYRLPGIYPQKQFVDDGGLMSYGVDFDDLYRRTAVYVDKILRGAKPGDLPVQQATKFEFVINLKAAKQIGLTIPVRLLERANQVIK
jgi:putative ABC transport system substrate-binding protein